MDALAAAIVAVRDASRHPAERALAAAMLSAGDVPDETSVEIPTGPSHRMFDYGVRHDGAPPWDGRSPRSGTITYVASGRVEQYVGRQSWVAFPSSDFAEGLPAVGDQLRVAKRGAMTEVESVGPNRLGSAAVAAPREISSGMVLFTTDEIETAAIMSAAGAVAQRYGGSDSFEPDGVTLVFDGSRVRVFPVRFGELDIALQAARRLPQPIATALRLEVTVRADRADAALTAERALVLCAAVLAGHGDAVAIDDTDACFSADDLVGLADRNAMRGDAFAFAAAAARQYAPPAAAWIADDEPGGELTVFSSRSWDAEAAQRTLQRLLAGLAAAAQRTGDPVIPDEGAFPPDDGRGTPGTVQPLVWLAYETVEIVVSFIDATQAHDVVREVVAARSDVAALLGAPVRSVVIIAFRPRGETDNPAHLALELERADAVVTALAALVGRRGDAIASDAAGALRSIDQLVEDGLHRRGSVSLDRASR